jgi:hypothetical protein
MMSDPLYAARQQLKHNRTENCPNKVGKHGNLKPKKCTCYLTRPDNEKFILFGPTIFY